MNESSSDLRRGSQQVSTTHARCSAYSWCQWTDGHSPEDHASTAGAVAATADPETYDYDRANGAVRVPLVMTYLTVPMDGHRAADPPTVLLNVTAPGKHRDVDVSLTLREATILRDQLDDLIEEARR